MTNQIQTFNFTQNEVRTSQDEKGEPLFCLTDVAKVLDIQNPNPSRFNFKEAGVHKMYISFPSGKKEVTFIDERNLYRMIFRSNKPQAVKFQDWVYDEVIPAIRKTGSYNNNQTTIEISFDELTYGGVTDYDLRRTLDNIIHEVAKCYVDREQETTTIEKHIADVCKIPHHSWITKDRFGVALYALSQISLKAYTHKQVLKQIDNNAIECLESVVIKNPVIVYQGV